jgi:hypothetical protein
VERGRNRKWLRLFVGYVVGSAAGGAATGAIAGLIGVVITLSTTVRLAAAAVVVVTAFGADAMGWSANAFGLRRQVQEEWRYRYRPFVTGVGYGVQLGTGFATLVGSFSMIAWVVLAMLTGSLPYALAVGVVFGVARALTLAPARRITDRAALTAYMTAHDARRREATRSMMGLEAMVTSIGAVVCVAVAVVGS